MVFDNVLMVVVVPYVLPCTCA